MSTLTFFKWYGSMTKLTKQYNYACVSVDQGYVLLAHTNYDVQ